MPQDIDAIVLPDGTVRLTKPITIGEARRAVLHVSDECVTVTSSDEGAWLDAAARSVEMSMPDDDFSNWPGYAEALKKAQAQRHGGAAPK